MYALVYFLVLHIVLIFNPVILIFTKPIEMIGKNTLGMYLLHSSMLPVFMRGVRCIEVGGLFWKYMLFFGTYILVIACSYAATVLIRKYIEKPFFNLFKRKDNV